MSDAKNRKKEETKKNEAFVKPSGMRVPQECPNKCLVNPKPNLLPFFKLRPPSSTRSQGSSCCSSGLVLCSIPRPEPSGVAPCYSVWTPALGPRICPIPPVVRHPAVPPLRPHFLPPCSLSVYSNSTSSVSWTQCRPGLCRPQPGAEHCNVRWGHLEGGAMQCLGRLRVDCSTRGKCVVGGQCRVEKPKWVNASVIRGSLRGSITWRSRVAPCCRNIQAWALRPDKPRLFQGFVRRFSYFPQIPLKRSSSALMESKWPPTFSLLQMNRIEVAQLP